MPDVLACVLRYVLNITIDLFYDRIMEARDGNHPAEV